MVWLVIGAGGAIGAMARHLVNTMLQPRAAVFPFGIAVVNVLGCLAGGLLAGLLASGRLQVSEMPRLFLVVGLLGGFTTFSAFGLDTVTLLRGGHSALALANIAGQPVLGVAAVWLGFTAGLWRP